jgi:hypothetical protein
MSESAAEGQDGAGTAQADGVQGTSETDTEDADAAQLLGGMLKDPEALAAELDRIKKESRKWEGRAKANSEAASKLQEIENANKTELEKAQQAAADAAQQRDAALATHARVMAAAAHNLPVELIDHLGSGTEEEINERAEAIAKAIDERANAIAEQLVANAAAGRNGMPMGARPVESLRPGSAPASGGTPQTPDQWFRKLLGQ